MTGETTEGRPAVVPERAKQAGETQTRWGWVEPSVCTERMLTALERGVKGGKWFSLIDKVYAAENLRAGFKKVKAKRGVAGADHEDHQRWTNDYFTGQGLYSLVTAHAAARQSCSR